MSDLPQVRSVSRSLFPNGPGVLRPLLADGLNGWTPQGSWRRSNASRTAIEPSPMAVRPAWLTRCGRRRRRRSRPAGFQEQRRPVPGLELGRRRIAAGEQEPAGVLGELARQPPGASCSLPDRCRPFSGDSDTALAACLKRTPNLRACRGARVASSSPDRPTGKPGKFSIREEVLAWPPSGTPPAGGAEGGCPSRCAYRPVVQS